MTKPSSIPDVEVSTDDGPTDPAGAPDGSTPGETTQTIAGIDEQIWMRSAVYASGKYTLTLAAAPHGSFMLEDLRAVGGPMALTAGMAAPPECTTVAEKPLSQRIAGAIPNVTHLVTLTCPAAHAMKRPAVVGNWGDATHAGQAFAIFALGEAKAQGRPDRPGTAPEGAHADPVDVHVVSAKHSGTTATITVWATEYVSLNLTAPPSDSVDAPIPDCTSTPSRTQRPGVATTTPQRLFTLTCRGVTTLSGWTLDAMHAEGRLGGEPTFDTETISLPRA